MTGLRAATAALLAAAALLCARPAASDRASADFFTQRGDKAIKDKKWKEAEEHYRKATEEEEGHVPGTVGLGEALFGAGDRGAAIDAWRRAVAKADATPALPKPWVEAAARARKRLLEVDAAGTALAQAVDKYVESLVALAERWSAKDSTVAAQAVRDALRLRPANGKARALASKVGPAPPEWELLCDGTSLADFGGTSEEFRLEDGKIVVDVKNATLSIHHKQEYRGDFAIRVEARVIEWRDHGMLAIGAAITEHTYGSWLGIGRTDIDAREVNGNGAGKQPVTFTKSIASLPCPFDPTEWTTYEFQALGKEYHFLVNGSEVGVVERPKSRQGGLFGLFGQGILYEVRKVEAIQR